LASLITPLPLGGGGDSRLQLLGDGAERLVRLARHRAATRVDRRTLRGQQQSCAAARAIVGSGAAARSVSARRQQRRLALFFQHVGRELEMHGPAGRPVFSWRTAARHRSRHVADLEHAAPPLRDPGRWPAIWSLTSWSTPTSRPMFRFGTWPQSISTGELAAYAVERPAAALSRPGPGDHECRAEAAARGRRVAVGHVGGGLLVARVVMKRTRSSRSPASAP